jgi:hypothetical protein
MRIRTTTTGLLALTGILLGLLAAAPESQARFAIGIGDQHPESFTQPLFQQLRFGYARLIVPWDALRRPDDLARIDAWLTAAQVSRIRPLVTFEHSRVHPRTLPSPGQFKREFKAFRKRYPFVRDYSPWNEINHQSQPTFRKPKAAARFYNVVRASCRGCTIVAADVLDQAGLEKYLRTFKHYARGTPRLWGLHNYSDTNRFRSRGTKSLLRTVRGTVWLTETGGIVKFADVLPYNEQRAARATKYMFKLARSNRRIKRLYIYSWLGEQRGARFDAGLVGPNGSARPAFQVVKNEIGKR